MPWGFALLFSLLDSIFPPPGLLRERDTKRGRRRSVEVTSRPRFELQLRAGGSALLGEGRVDASRWEMEGEGPDLGGDWSFALLEGDPGRRRWDE